MTVLVRDAEVNGRRCDVLVRDGAVDEIGEGLVTRGHDHVLEARGGALLPGLHDHHVHLLATASAAVSVGCGPPDVVDADGLGTALARASEALPPGEWLRGVGYAETVAGALDRWALDRLVGDRPTRVQHRGGALWVLNSAALEAADLLDVHDQDVERAADGSLTGRLWRYDSRLRERLKSADPPDLAALGKRLLAYGITGVTDATPDLDTAALRMLEQAVTSGELPQQVLLLGAPDDAELPEGLAVGPRKLLLRDHDLPPFDELCSAIEGSHRVGRPVAVHCVTRESLVLTVVALDAVGALPGDRIEHAAVVPPALVPRLAALGVVVVTQPSFIRSRGDDYLREVDPDDLPHLYPFASLLAAGVCAVPSSDAPFGDLDPWRTLVDAADRRTRAGGLLGAEERVRAAVVLNGYLAPLDDPGGAPRAVRRGVTADLCLLDAPLGEVLREPSAERVLAVLRAGRLAV